MKGRIPTPASAMAVRKAYKAVAKYSLDTGNRLEEIGPEAVTHLVAFWEYINPVFRQMFMEVTEKHLRSEPEFAALDNEGQQEKLVELWNEYVTKHQILDSPHAWVMEKQRKLPSKLGEK